MYLHHTHVKSILFLTMIALLQGCGSNQTQEKNSQPINQLQLDEENYFEVSQYIYTRQRAIKKAQRTKTNRTTTPHVTTDIESSNPNILKVQAQNGRVEIKQQQKTILVNVDDKSKKVVVFYDDGNSHKKQSSALKKFNDFNEEIN